MCQIRKSGIFSPILKQKMLPLNNNNKNYVQKS